MNEKHDTDEDSNCSSVNENYEFNWLLFKRLARLFRILFPNIRSPAWKPFLLFTFSALIYEVLIFHSGLVPAKFIKVIVEGDKNGYFWELVGAFILIILKSLSKSTKRYMRCLLQTSWREKICQEIHRKYFHGINYYHINITDKNIDNPDQRLGQDLGTLVDSMGEVIADVILRPFSIIYYSYEVYITTGWLGIVASYLLSTVFVCINLKLLSPIVRTTADLDKKEGNYRFQHMHVRVYAESIALQGSESVEMNLADKRFTSVIKSTHLMIWNRYLAFTAMDLFIFSQSILSFAIFSIPYFSGAFSGLSAGELGEKISRNTFVVSHLVLMFTDFIDNTMEISEMAGTTHRVAEFIEALDDLIDTANHRALTYEASKKETQELEKIQKRGCLYEIKNLSILPPTRFDVTKPIISDLSLKIEFNSRIAICGKGNCGKTSILRVLRGLWPTYDKVWISEYVKNPNFVMFLPQKPLLTTGSLRAQLLYPKTVTEPHMCSDKQILRYLEELLLSDLLHKVGGLDEDTNWNWYDVLSPSEAHRIGIVRMFTHRPKVVFLDDIFGTIDPILVNFVYEEFKNLNMTYVTIGDESTLSKYHDHILRLKTDGSWSLNSVN